MMPLTSLGRARRERRRNRQPHAPAHAGHLRRARQRESRRAARSRATARGRWRIAMGGGEYAEIVKWRDKVMQRVAAENPTHPQSRIRLPRAPAARDRADRSQQGRGPRRFAADRRAARSRPCWARASSPRSNAAARNTTSSCRRASEQRASVGDLDNLYVRSDKNGDLLPLSALVQHRRARRAHRAAAHGSHARDRARGFAGAWLHARRGGRRTWRR